MKLERCASSGEVKLSQVSSPLERFHAQLDDFRDDASIKNNAQISNRRHHHWRDNIPRKRARERERVVARKIDILGVTAMPGARWITT